MPHRAGTMSRNRINPLKEMEKGTIQRSCPARARRGLCTRALAARIRGAVPCNPFPGKAQKALRALPPGNGPVPNPGSKTACPGRVGVATEDDGQAGCLRDMCKPIPIWFAC